MRKRLLFLLGALIVYRIGTFIPVPGIDAARFATFFSTQQGTLLGMFNMFSGGALQRFSIFALNVMPYITASIIVQMASMVYPPWNQIRKDGESGRRKLMQYTRYGTVGLAGIPGFRRGARHPEFRQQPGAEPRARSSCSSPPFRSPPAPCSSCGWASRSPSAASATASP